MTMRSSSLFVARDSILLADPLVPFACSAPAENASYTPRRGPSRSARPEIADMSIVILRDICRSPEHQSMSPEGKCALGQ